MKKLFFVLVLVVAGAASYAQTAPLKIGYADIQYIFSQMPESKAMENELQTMQTMLKKQYDSKVAEFQKKLQEYQQFGATVPDAVKQNSERELQQLQQNIQKLEQDSQNDLQRKQEQLLAPIQLKVGKAIEDMSKENGFTFVLISQIGGVDVILYADEKMDVSDLVLKKMGITPTPPAANKPAPQKP